MSVRSGGVGSTSRRNRWHPARAAKIAMETAKHLGLIILPRSRRYADNVTRGRGGVHLAVRDGRDAGDAAVDRNSFKLRRNADVLKSGTRARQAWLQAGVAADERRRWQNGRVGIGVEMPIAGTDVDHAVIGELAVTSFGNGS